MPMNAATKQKLIHAVTAYDRKQEGRRGYNRYALAQYLDRVEDASKHGGTLRQALVANFNDRLLDVCLKAVGEPKATYEELRGW